MHNSISARLGVPMGGRGRGSPFHRADAVRTTGPRQARRVRRGTIAATLLLAAGAAFATPAFAQQQQSNADEGGTVPPGTKNGDWVLPARTYQMTRYSPLDQITTSNVSNLKEVFTYTDGIKDGHEGQPLFVNNTLYMVTPFPNRLYAFSLNNGKFALKWMYDPHPNPAAPGKACCDNVNRGMTYYKGKIIYNVLDDNMVAVDANTGKEAWRIKLGDVNKGETMTMAAVVVNGIAYGGVSGGEMGVHGWLAAVNADNGKLLWRAYSTGSDKETMMGSDFHPYYKYMQGKDMGMKSWQGDQWKIGGAAPWTWVSYDPTANTIYYGTSNPGTWNPDQRPGDNLWSTSVIARDAKTGMAKWAYSFTPHDEWDYDGINENVVIDLPINGQARKVIVHVDRNGYIYTIDRTNGQVLVANPFEKVNWSTGIDMQTGRPKLVAEKETHQGKLTKNICPSSSGARDQQPSAYSPKTHLLYTGATRVCMDYGGIETKYIAGTAYVGAAVRMFAQDNDMSHRGDLIAWDPATGTAKWRDAEKYPVWSGVLATASNVVFYGTMDGDFKAVDATTGKELWKTHFDSGIIGNPMTFTGSDGKQYVAIYSGVGGWLGAIVPGNLSKDDHWAALGAVGAMYDLPDDTKPGGALHVFALPGSAPGGNPSGK
ncbi:MAG TPA: PQQ-dependent dehydrogenase, methanol/ethanol family [Gemmatimonadaceae bacterium]